MESSSLALIITLFILIIMSGYFSSTETAFSSLNKIRLKNMAEKGDQRAAKTLQLSENFDQLLSTILIGNNIVNIVSASLATVLFVGYFGNMGVTLSTVVMTILLLIFGEISPKSLAKEKPEAFAMFATPLISILITLFTPLNWFFSLWRKMLSMIFKFESEQAITDEELLTIVEEAETGGGIGEHESELIKSAIEFKDLDAEDILTPRVNVVGIEIEDSNEEITKLFSESGYSRLPVYEGSMDKVLGIIHEKDFHRKVLDSKESLESIISPVIFIAASMKISKLLKRLQQVKTHMAVVTDEYGGTVGIVTLEDILEQLVGDIYDEHDKIIEEVTEIGEEEYMVECSANIEKVFALFGLEPDEEWDVSTVNGWVLHSMGKIPEVGEQIISDGLSAVITKANDRMVQEIHLKRAPEPEPIPDDEQAAAE